MQCKFDRISGFVFLLLHNDGEFKIISLHEWSTSSFATFLFKNKNDQANEESALAAVWRHIFRVKLSARISGGTLQRSDDGKYRIEWQKKKWFVCIT